MKQRNEAGATVRQEEKKKYRVQKQKAAVDSGVQPAWKLTWSGIWLLFSGLSTRLLCSSLLCLELQLNKSQVRGKQSSTEKRREKQNIRKKLNHAFFILFCLILFDSFILSLAGGLIALDIT